MLVKRFFKLLHTVGAIGLIGGFAAYLVLAAPLPGRTVEEQAIVRGSIAAICKWLIFPSLPLVVISGLLSMAIHAPFHNAGWVWSKLATGVLMVEGTLGVQGRADDVAKMAAAVAAGGGDPVELARLIAHERIGIGVIMTLALANVVVGIWRPRFKNKKTT